MILADTSVWIEHLRAGLPRLTTLLEAGLIRGHPYVAAELALGSMSSRGQVLRLLDGLRQAPLLRPDEVRLLIERHRLWGRGIGLVDAALLGACLLEGDARLWTLDRRLSAVAGDLGVALQPAP